MACRPAGVRYSDAAFPVSACYGLGLKALRAVREGLAGKPKKYSNNRSAGTQAAWPKAKALKRSSGSHVLRGAAGGGLGRPSRVGARRKHSEVGAGPFLPCEHWALGMGSSWGNGAPAQRKGCGVWEVPTCFAGWSWARFTREQLHRPAKLLRDATPPS